MLIAFALLGSFCSAVYWLYRIRSAWRLAPRLLKQQQGGQPRRVLVLGLSTPPEQVRGFDLGNGASIELHHQVAGELLEIHTLENATTSMQRHPWQQSLRAIDHHARETLELLVVVPSAGSGGSGHYTEQFEQWIRHYQKTGNWKRFEIRTLAAVDYEHFQDIQDAYMGALRFAETRSYGESDVVLDITSGKKPSSIAAAMVTLATDVEFQYVQTEPPFGLVTYSVVSEGLRDPT